MKFLNKYLAKLLIILDLIVPILSIKLAFYFNPFIEISDVRHISESNAIILNVINYFMITSILGANNLFQIKSKPSIIFNIFLISVLVLILNPLMIYLINYNMIGRYILGLNFIIFALIMIIIKIPLHIFLLSKKLKIYYIGSKNKYHYFKKLTESNLIPVDIVLNTEKFNIPSFDKLKHDIDIIIADDLELIRNTNILFELNKNNILVYNVVKFVEDYVQRIPIELLDKETLYSSKVLNYGSINKKLIRILDVVLSVFALVISQPFIFLIRIIIKFSSKGPTIFKQKRVGQYNNIFTILKLRTMSVSAELNEAKWASPNDPRAFTFGKFLRKSRLDEFPQFWNVLIGDMSIVGPRPERPELINKIKKEIPHYEERHLIKPGITGWAQINYRYGASVDDTKIKLEYDLYYVRNYNLLLYLFIILRTIISIMKGAR